MTYTRAPAPVLKYLYESSSGLVTASRRSSPHDGTGDCSAIDFMGVSAMTVIPEVLLRARATDVGTTNVVALLLSPTIAGAAPSEVVSSDATASAR